MRSSNIDERAIIFDGYASSAIGYNKSEKDYMDLNYGEMKIDAVLKRLILVHALKDAKIRTTLQKDGLSQGRRLELITRSQLAEVANNIYTETEYGPQAPIGWLIVPM